MHIPDGLMDPLILAVGWIIAIVAIAVSLRLVNRRFEERHIPLMAVLAAGIFVAQMLNFPVGGGTTGHLVGACLAAILLGPYAGMVIMTTILVIQCFLFGDGGVTALGLNILNMAVIGCFVGSFFYTAFPKRYRKVGVFVASWLSVFIGAFACALELSFSYSLSAGTYGIASYISIPSMLGYHAVIGIGEAIVTTSVVAYLAHVSPEMLRMSRLMKRGAANARRNVREGADA